MLATIKSIFIDNIKLQKVSWQLGLLELEKERRGTALGWIWLFFRPILFISFFSLALGIGLRQFKEVGGDYPYLLFLACGLIPWFYMQKMIAQGSNVFRRKRKYLRYSNLPLSVMPTIHSNGKLLIFSISILATLIIAICFGVQPQLYWLQVIPITIIMVVFFFFLSLLTSCFSALSKDFSNFISSMTMPMFWVSGVIFNVDNVDWPPFQWFLLFNPITFIVRSFRAAVCDGYWVFNQLEYVLPFAIVFLVVVSLACYFFYYLQSEVRDVITEA